MSRFVVQGGHKLRLALCKSPFKVSLARPELRRPFKTVASSQQEALSINNPTPSPDPVLFRHTSGLESSHVDSDVAEAISPGSTWTQPATYTTTKVQIESQTVDASSILLRDLCECPRCVDSSTKQKLFSTADIPASIQGIAAYDPATRATSIRWMNDIAAYDANHVTTLSDQTLTQLLYSRRKTRQQASNFPRRKLWEAQQFATQCEDIDYDDYMQSDHAVLRALHQLHSHGLLFLSNVPESADSVSTIVERIGPLKNTFYGSTWDVRSVPEAKNVAYTAQDLGFHMDLMYMQQPPHLQFLHCIRSSAAGGASLFTDSIRAARDLWLECSDAVRDLCRLPVNFHYNHPESHYYHRSRKVIELVNSRRLMNFLPGREGANSLVDSVKHISWAPPFQAPFLSSAVGRHSRLSGPSLHRWHAAAARFSEIVHGPQGIYERMMKPGECVIFDNRRVLHARRAFEVGDAGKERWLRGAYMDEDPFLSKTKVLQNHLGTAAVFED